jgi:hypothetical protein
MIDLKDYKKTSLDFRRIASNMLRTEYNNPNTPLQRFKNYIDTNDIVKEIVQEAIKDVVYDYNNCFVKSDNYWAKLNIPVNENEHLRAMYDYMSFIVDNNVNVLNISNSYLCSSRKFTDIIQNFLSLAFKPMVDYIIDELSKMILMEEEEMKGITINNDKGVVNVADRNSTITSNNNININENDIESIAKIITSLKEEINKIGIPNEEKESVIDDLDIIQEQVDESISKPARFKKAFNNIKNFLSSSTAVVGAGIALSDGITKLIEIVKPIIDKL